MANLPPNNPPQPPERRKPKSTQKLAVAIEHDIKTDTVPTVVATGRGLVAEQILSIAFANGVKVREDPDLAQMLAELEVGWQIPLEAFMAVAEILSYVYRANGITPPWEKKDES
ncbi:MAG: EscU/YscU/HrcU family type III secretion system export apparatus switch protein [Dongiaceae bacterium]